LGEFGPGPDDYFWKLRDLCFDKAGDLFVGDRGWAKVHKFDAQGKFLKSFGRKGQGPGELSDDLALTLGNDGFLYAADPMGSRISRFDLDGKYSTAGLSHGYGRRPSTQRRDLRSSKGWS
jgi:hypothetical protein